MRSNAEGQRPTCRQERQSEELGRGRVEVSNAAQCGTAARQRWAKELDGDCVLEVVAVADALKQVHAGKRAAVHLEHLWATQGNRIAATTFAGRAVGVCVQLLVHRSPGACEAL